VVQLFNGASFYVFCVVISAKIWHPLVLRYSHHFFHFVADFVTLSHAKMIIFPGRHLPQREESIKK